MRPALRRATLALACTSALVLSGCGKHTTSNAPITFAPADTPYLFANFKGRPQDVAQAWDQANDAMMAARIQQLGQMARIIDTQDPKIAAVLNATQAELANVHTSQDLAKTIGFSQSALSAIYGIGDVPVMRIELDSPDTFKAFWARVEKRAGVAAATATLGKQSYWVLGGNDAKLHFLVAIEGNQLVATLAPANASADMLKHLLGLIKPSSNASARLASIDSSHGYSDYGSGYLDLPKLFANLFDGKDAITQEFAKDLGGSLANPACATEFASLAGQAPLMSAGLQTYTAKEVHASVDVKLSPSLLGALSALKQPVAGMDSGTDNSMLDLVLALPLQKWQAFFEARAEAAAANHYQCPALQSLNGFAAMAAHPPVQMPPEAASILGFRVVLDTWNTDPTQITGRVLVASSDTAALTQKLQQTLPQFALKSIPTDGKPVAFQLPPQFQTMLGSGTQGWIAADAHSLALGVGNGEDGKLAGTLTDAAGNGDRLLRMHFDGKLYQLFANFIGRFTAMMPPQKQAQMQQQVALMTLMSKMIQSADMDARLDDKGLHFDVDVRHR
jgi:hypothetical protein